MGLWLIRIASLIVACQCGVTLADHAVKKIWCVKDGAHGERCRLGLLEAGTLSYSLTLTEWVRSDHSHPFQLHSVMRFKPKDYKIPPSLDILPYAGEDSDFEKAVTALVVEAAEGIPEKERGNTVLYFKATEAFRKMEADEREERFTVIQRVFEKLQFPIISQTRLPREKFFEGVKNFFLGKSRLSQQFDIIDEDTEAKLGWFGASQLLASKYGSGPNTVMDMGGGTMVVAQSKTDPLPNPTSNVVSNGIVDHNRATAMRKLITFSTPQSFLDARAQIALHSEKLSPTVEGSSASTGTTDASGKIILSSYCMPMGLKQPISLDNREFAIGSPPEHDFKKCREAAMEYVNELMSKNVPPPQLRNSQNLVLIGQFFVIGNHAHAVKRKSAALHYMPKDQKELLGDFIISKGDEMSVKEVDHFTLQVGDFLICADVLCVQALSENDQRGGWRCVDCIFAYSLLTKFGLADWHKVFIVDKAPMVEGDASTDMKVSWGSGFLFEFVTEQSRGKGRLGP